MIKPACNDYAGRLAGEIFGTSIMTYVKVKFWLEGFGGCHHCVGDDETAEDTCARALGERKGVWSRRVYAPLPHGGRMTFFERYKLTSRFSMSRRGDIWVGSVNL